MGRQCSEAVWIRHTEPKNNKIAAELAKAKDNNKPKANSPITNENENLETINEEEGDNQTRARRALGSKSLHCDHCDLETRSTTFLKRHMRIKHAEYIQCEHC